MLAEIPARFALVRVLVRVIALIGVTTGLLVSGSFSQQTLASPLAASFHLHVLTVAHWLAPFQNARLALGVATAYLFLQSVHYSAWLNWIPQQEQPGRGTFTFRMSARSLFADARLVDAKSDKDGLLFDAERVPKRVRAKKGSPAL